MIRPPAVAGGFYAGTLEELSTQITNCFKADLGAGIPKVNSKPMLKAGIAPHAGYVYSGSVASHLYKKIAEGKKAQTYIILGPNHTGVGTAVSVYTEGAWATPLGQVEIDSEIANKLIQESNILKSDDTAHLQEHSIEVQVPFLQFVQEKFKIVPICMMQQDMDTAQELGKAIAKICKNLDVTVIASSDFTHFEPHPLASEKDAEAIKKIEKLDSAGLYDVLEGNSMSVCGYGPIAAAMTYAKEIGLKKGTLLKYATSGDVTGDKTSVVGYASIAFE